MTYPKIIDKIEKTKEKLYINICKYGIYSENVKKINDKHINEL